MSGLFGSLSSGVKALNAQSRALETAGRNIANVNNANYARQRVVLGDRGTVLTAQGAQSLGVEARQVQQLRDLLLDRQVSREIALTTSLSSRQFAYQKAEAALGHSIDRSANASAAASSTGGVAGSLGDFFSAFDAFATSPTDTGVRQTLLQKASVLTDSLQQADTRLDQLQDDLTEQMATDVGEVNTLLDAIATLNGQIGHFEINSPGSAADLRDQRQARLEQLATKLNFETRASSTAPGQIDLFVRATGGGTEIPLVQLNAVTGPVTRPGVTLTAGAPPAAVAVTGGALHGNLEARDGTVQTLRDQLDALASQLVSEVNTAYNPTGVTGDFFDPAGTTAGTIALAGGLTPATLKASDGGPAGDNTLALAVAQLANHTFSTAGGDAINGTFAKYFAGVVSNFGAVASRVSDQYEDQHNIENIVRAQRDTISGVSMDEELADLVKYQRSFQASSRVIQVIDELLDTIVNRLGS